ncbi:MAG: erythromycin esterase family protein [Thermomicrobiales bacterium]|nr:erythromycin esterase family protein [Thermomicrobiales bacterium]
MTLPFRDRRDAGQHLASHLQSYVDDPNVIVLGLPRGGVPVAAEVAAALHAPLDAFLVRKLGVPGHEELAMGAIASGGVRVLNEEIVSGLQIPQAVIDAAEAAERRELARRERVYRGGQPRADLVGKVVILVDDGLATGSTMRAAVQAVRQLRPARIVAAVPVGAASVCSGLRAFADDVICAETPDPFHAVGIWYEDFQPTSDEEVQAALRDVRPAARPATPAPAVVAPAADVSALRAAAIPVAGVADLDPILDLIGAAKLVLIGEASHGTDEFYRTRAAITRRLIAEQGFTAVAVEADWPDALRVTRYVWGAGPDTTAEAALGDFRRFPRWMWRNTVVREFVEWLRGHNLGSAAPAGFYGLDLYSLHTSVAAVLGYLDRVDPAGAQRARARYACFDHFGDDPQVYGYATTAGIAETCENEVVGQLVEMQREAGRLAASSGDGDEAFFAVQNARLVRNAEAYYRAMFAGRIPSWNLRDQHMAETLEALRTHLQRDAGEAKVVVWAHNSHLGDASATAMAAEGELNLGQLVRERHGREAFLLGFTTHHGTVTAASNWDEPARQRQVRPALAGSYEALLHEAATSEMPDFLLNLRDAEVASRLRPARLERAIGVIYRPETERFSHYFLASLPDQFDAVVHLDRTTALTPLDPDPGWETAEELPETFPFGV